MQNHPSTAKKTTRFLAPKNVKTFSQMCALQRDNYDTKNFWILLESSGRSHEVVLAAQKSGEDATAKITIPRRDFLALIDWYQREQPSRRGKR